MQQHQPRVSPKYDEDFYAWTQQQAKLLRAAQESGIDLPSGIDVEHLAEEIQDLGKAELRGVTSILRQILLHLIKAASDPRSNAAPHWRTEATNFQLDLPDRYAPSMRQLIDMQDLWRRALKGSSVNLREHGGNVAPHIPDQCPYSLDDLLDEEFDFDAALKKITGSGV